MQEVVELSDEEVAPVVQRFETTPRKQLQPTRNRFWSPGGVQSPAVDPLQVLAFTTPRKGPGRPRLHASPALEVAREEGRQLVLETASPAGWSPAVASGGFARKNKGGRPLVHSAEEYRKTLQANSNRREPGTQRKRRDETAATKLAMCRKMHEMALECANPAEWKTRCSKKYDLPWWSLQRILKKEEVWSEAVAAQEKLKHGKKPAQAKRAAGAGRPDLFKRQKLQLKAWLEQERAHGHHVDKSDMCNEFKDLCQDEAEEILQVLEERAKLKLAEELEPLQLEDEREPTEVADEEEKGAREEEEEKAEEAAEAEEQQEQEEPAEQAEAAEVE